MNIDKAKLTKLVTTICQQLMQTEESPAKQHSVMVSFDTATPGIKATATALLAERNPDGTATITDMNVFTGIIRTWGQFEIESIREFYRKQRGFTKRAYTGRKYKKTELPKLPEIAVVDSKYDAVIAKLSAQLKPSIKLETVISRMVNMARKCTNTDIYVKAAQHRFSRTPYNIFLNIHEYRVIYRKHRNMPIKSTSEQIELPLTVTTILPKSPAVPEVAQQYKTSTKPSLEDLTRLIKELGLTPSMLVAALAQEQTVQAKEQTAQVSGVENNRVTDGTSGTAAAYISQSQG